MARTKLIFPTRPALFTTEIQVAITDLNYGNHVGNDKMLGIIHEARVRFLAAHKMSELAAAGTSLIMAESLVIYKNESFYGDSLKISIWAVDISGVSFDLMYQISCEREGKEVQIAQAKTVMISFDYAARKTQPLPEALSKILEG